MDDGWSMKNIVVCFLVLIIFVISSCLMNEVRIKERECNSLMYENTLLVETILRQYETCGRMENLKLFDGERYFHLSEMLDEEYELIVWFSELQCSVCVDFVLEKLKGLYDETLNGKVVVIGSFRDKRSYKEFIKDKQMPFHILGEMENLRDMTFKEDIPSMFLLNKKMEKKNLFYPVKEIPYLMEQYIKIINKQLKIKENEKSFIDDGCGGFFTCNLFESGNSNLECRI